jgi:hypothetical protein
MVQDPTYTHEHLAYQMFRAAGVPAPRTGYTELWINNSYYGLYLWVESVDDSFLERWFADPTGTLYEGAYGVDFQLGMEGSFEYDEGANPDDRADLTAVATVLSGEPNDAAIEALGRLVDMPEFLRVMAVETLIEHWDGYTTANNYRVYHDPVTERFFMIPWGTDQTFIADGFGPYDTYGDLLAFCMLNEGCLRQYEDTMLAMADVMEATPLEAEMDTILAWLAPKITSDPLREHDQATFDSYVAATRDTLRGSPQRIRDAVAARRAE